MKRREEGEKRGRKGEEGGGREEGGREGGGGRDEGGGREDGGWGRKMYRGEGYPGKKGRGGMQEGGRDRGVEIRIGQEGDRKRRERWKKQYVCMKS